MVFSVLCFFFKPASWHLLLYQYRSIHFDAHISKKHSAIKSRVPCAPFILWAPAPPKVSARPCTQPCPSDLSAHTHPVCDVCVRALWLTLHSHGASASTLDGGRVWSVVLTRRHSYNNQSHTSLVLHERDWVFAWGDLIGWRLRWHLKSCVSTTLQTRPPSSVDADFLTQTARFVS